MCDPIGSVVPHSHSAFLRGDGLTVLESRVISEPKAEFVPVKEGIKPCPLAPSHGGFTLPQGCCGHCDHKEK